MPGPQEIPSSRLRRASECGQHLVGEGLLALGTGCLGLRTQVLPTRTVSRGRCKDIKDPQPLWGTEKCHGFRTCERVLPRAGSGEGLSGALESAEVSELSHWPRHPQQSHPTVAETMPARWFWQLPGAKVALSCPCLAVAGLIPAVSGSTHVANLVTLVEFSKDLGVRSSLVLLRPAPQSSRLGLLRQTHPRASPRRAAERLRPFLSMPAPSPSSRPSASSHLGQLENCPFKCQEPFPSVTVEGQRPVTLPHLCAMTGFSGASHCDLHVLHAARWVAELQR